MSILRAFLQEGNGSQRAVIQFLLRGPGSGVAGVRHSQVSWKGRRELGCAKGGGCGGSAGGKPATGIYKSLRFTGKLLLLRSEETKYPGGEVKSNFWEVIVVSSQNICQPRCQREATNTWHESGSIKDVSLQEGVGGK